MCCSISSYFKARSGADQMSSSGSRSCPKKTILLPSSSSTSSLSLHSEVTERLVSSLSRSVCLPPSSKCTAGLFSVPLLSLHPTSFPPNVLLSCQPLHRRCGGCSGYCESIKCCISQSFRLRELRNDVYVPVSECRYQRSGLFSC